MHTHKYTIICIDIQTINTICFVHEINFFGLNVMFWILSMNIRKNYEEKVVVHNIIIFFFIKFCSSDNSEAATKDSDKPTTSIVGSLTDFFTGGEGEEEDDIEKNISMPPPIVNNKKKDSSVSGTKSKPPIKKLKNNDDPWFDDIETAFNSSPKKTTSNENPWFGSSETTSNLLPKTVPKPKSDDWFENSNANSDNGKVRNNGKIYYSKKEVVTKKSGSGSFSDNDFSEISKPTTVKTNTKVTPKKPILEEYEDFESYEV